MPSVSLVNFVAVCADLLTPSHIPALSLTKPNKLIQNYLPDFPQMKVDDLHLLFLLSTPLCG